MMTGMRRMAQIGRFLLVFILLYPAGLFIHEVIGHGLPGLIFGGKAEKLHMLGMNLYPRIKWVGWQGIYGYVDGTGVAEGWRMHVIGLCGSLSTAIVAGIALYLLWKKPRRGFFRLALISISLWWLDLFTYTLPSIGIRRSIFWGRKFSEPYEAAVALGCPGVVFQLFVVAVAVFFSVALWRILRRPVAK